VDRKYWPVRWFDHQGDILANPPSPSRPPATTRPRGHWLARAEEASGIAEPIQDPLAHKTLLEIAAGYERLASYARSATTRGHRRASIDIYRSSNGDRWRLISDTGSGHRLVRHEPNPASAGQVTETTIEESLAVNGPGPEYQALRRILDSEEQPRDDDC
jgi:hypothetical protein